MNTMEASTIDLLNSVSEFNDISDYMQDDELTEALVKIAKIIAKPDVPPAAAASLVVQLQAFSAKFGMLGSFYANTKKSPADRARKNIYYTATERVDKLVDALKYLARSNA